MSLGQCRVERQSPAAVVFFSSQVRCGSRLKPRPRGPLHTASGNLAGEPSFFDVPSVHFKTFTSPRKHDTRPLALNSSKIG
jgi:hypothetical protein